MSCLRCCDSVTVSSSQPIRNTQTNPQSKLYTGGAHVHRATQNNACALFYEFSSELFFGGGWRSPIPHQHQPRPPEPTSCDCQAALIFSALVESAAGRYWFCQSAHFWACVSKVGDAANTGGFDVAGTTAVARSVQEIITNRAGAGLVSKLRGPRGPCTQVNDEDII